MALNYVGKESLKEMSRLLLENEKKLKENLSLKISEKASSIDLSVERKRIDNLTKLPDGSTSGDAELVDIRVGIGGISYGTAGEAVRTQVKRLREELVDNLYPINHEKTCEISSTGDNYFLFNFEIGHEYTITNNTDSSCAFWSVNSDNNIVETITDGIASGRPVLFKPSKFSDKIRVYSNGVGSVKILENNTVLAKDFKILSNKLSDVNTKLIIGKNKFNKFEVEDRYYLSYDSEYKTENDSWCYMNYYSEVEPNTTYYMNKSGYHICFYDAYKKYIGGHTGNNVFTTPLSAKYIRVSCPISDKDTAYVVEGDQPTDYEAFYCDLAYSKSKSKKYYIVDKNGGGDFTSITEACNMAKDGYIIYIKPGVYDSEVITGTWSKKLYLIGESAKDTVIKNSLGDYNQPPIQIGSGYLKNLTFYSEYTGTQDRGTGASMSYAVHSESDNLANDNLTIEDCILISDYAPSFGMGMRGGCNVTLKNCYLKGTYNGALLFHDADNVSYVGEQNISLIDCVLYETNTSPCIIMQSQERSGTTVNLEMIRNRLKTQGSITYGTNNYYGGTGSGDDFLGLINFRLKETSWGNSDDTFNVD